MLILDKPNAIFHKYFWMYQSLLMPYEFIAKPEVFRVVTLHELFKEQAVS